MVDKWSYPINESRLGGASEKRTMKISKPEFNYRPRGRPKRDRRITGEILEGQGRHVILRRNGIVEPTRDVDYDDINVLFKYHWRNSSVVLKKKKKCRWLTSSLSTTDNR